MQTMFKILSLAVYLTLIHLQCHLRKLSQAHYTFHQLFLSSLGPIYNHGKQNSNGDKTQLQQYARLKDSEYRFQGSPWNVAFVSIAQTIGFLAGYHLYTWVKAINT